MRFGLPFLRTIHDYFRSPDRTSKLSLNGDGVIRIGRAETRAGCTFVIIHILHRADCSSLSPDVADLTAGRPTDPLTEPLAKPGVMDSSPRTYPGHELSILQLLHALRIKLERDELLE